MLVSFSPKAWAHDLYWQETDRDILPKINDLIRECARRTKARASPRR